MKDVLDHFELTNSHLLGSTTGNASSNHWMTQEIQSTFEAAGIEWREMRNYIPHMGQLIQRSLGAFVSSLGVKGRTKLWESHERDQQFGENVCTVIGNIQRLHNEGNARMNKVSAMSIRKKHFCPVGMAPSEWTCSVRAVRDNPVADDSVPGINSTHRIPYRPMIVV